MGCKSTAIQPRRCEMEDLERIHGRDRFELHWESKDTLIPRQVKRNDSELKEQLCPLEALGLALTGASRNTATISSQIAKSTSNSMACEPSATSTVFETQV